jgi:hypothetical protein
MAKCSDDTSSIMNCASYTTTVGNNISSSARSLKSFRGVDTSSDLYVNSVQKEMEDKFKENDKNLADASIISVDNTSSNTITLNTETLMGSNGIEAFLNGSTLSKRRVC